MPNYFVLQLADYEYNDETYILEGYQAVEKVGFLSLEEAKAAGKEKLKTMLSGHTIVDFDYGWGDTSDPLLDQFKEESGFTKVTKPSNYGYDYVEWESATGAWLGDLNYLQFIEWCEAKGINWVKHVPSMLHISEIAFPNPCKKEEATV